MFRTVEEMTDKCLSSLEDNSDCHLEIGYRLWVYNYLGGNVEADTPADCQIRDVGGFERRAHLRLLTIRKVLPVWFARMPDDDMPKKLLEDTVEFVRKVKQSKINGHDADIFLDTSMKHFEYEYEGSHFYQRNLGDYALATGWTTSQIMGDIYSDYVNLTQGFQNTKLYDILSVDGDLDISFDTPESDFGAELLRYDSFACEVYSRFATYLTGGGEILEMNDDPETLRRHSADFWHWWLKEAVPSVYVNPLI